MSLTVDFSDGIIKAAPVVGAAVTEAASRYFGLTLHEWFYVTIIVYSCIQSWSLIYKTLKGGKTDE